MIYKGVSESSFHFVISEIKIPTEELIELYESLKEHDYPWNEYKRKYDSNKNYQPRGDGGLGAIYAPDKDGKDLIDYPVVQKLIKRFNFVNPNNTERYFHNLDPIDVAFMTYKPGFVFKKHIDREMHTNIMMPLIPKGYTDPIHYWKGTDKDRDTTTEKIGTYYYDTVYPSVTDGKQIHSVDEIKEPRVIFRIKITKETFQDMYKRYKEGKLINAIN